MADTKITDLATDASPTTSNYLLEVDVDDTTMASTGTNKKVLISALPFATIASPTFTGPVTEPVRVTTPHALTDGATITVDFSLSDYHYVTLGGNRTIAFSNAAHGQVVRIELIQDVSGSRTVTWPTVRWPGGTAPALATTGFKADQVVIVVRADGTYAGSLGISNY